MPTPANRAKIQLVRGSFSNISASISDLVDGELCYAKDQNRLYMVEGTTLTQVEADAEGIEDAIAAALAGGTGIGVTYDDPNDTITVALSDTAVTPAQYGSSSAIPIITVDQQGRITAASTTSIDTDVLLLSVHNQSGATINKGDVVYVSGTHSSGKPIIQLADNNGSNTYPAIGLVHADIANGADGNVIISGQLANVDTSSFSAGDALYLHSTAGELTTTRPTAATEKVQKVGLVTRSHASNGSILIIGAGRTNDVNNEITALTGVALNASDLGTFTGSTITDSSSIKTALQELETKAETAIVNADISATAEISVSKLGNGTARQLLQTSANGNDVEFTSNIDVPGTLDVTGNATFDQAVTITGNLTVNGTTTTIDSTTLVVEDRNIELGTVGTPTDSTADGGGLTLRGSTDKTINWVDSTDAWTLSEHVNIADTKEYRMNGTAVLAYSGSNKILDNVIVDGGTY